MTAAVFPTKTLNLRALAQVKILCMRGKIPHREGIPQRTRLNKFQYEKYRIKLAVRPFGPGGPGPLAMGALAGRVAGVAADVRDQRLSQDDQRCAGGIDPGGVLLSSSSHNP